jgi:hypothetical protein
MPPSNPYKTSAGLRASNPPRVSPCGQILVVVLSWWPAALARHGCRSPMLGAGWRSSAGPCGQWQVSGCRPDSGDDREGGVEAGIASPDLGESPRDPEEMQGSMLERGRSHTRTGRGGRAAPLA